MKWGKYESFLQAKADKGEIIPALLARPTLYPDLVCFWKAFGELHSSRPVAMAPTPIPIMDIFAWLTIQDIVDVETRQEYFQFISVLDSAWLTWARKEYKAESERKR